MGQHSTLRLMALAALVAPGTVAAQDVVERGRQHGSQPPSVYFQRLAQEPDAFEFRFAWIARGLEIAQRRQALYENGQLELMNSHFRAGLAAPSTAAVNQTAVAGTFTFPVFAVYFADSTHTFHPDLADLQLTYFGSSTTPYTLSTYYEEVSAGLLDLTGNVIGWIKADHDNAYYAGSTQGLGGDSHVRELVRELVQKADSAGLDFSEYDGDGDGIVDVVAVIHPHVDGACGTPNIWPHRSGVFPPEPTNDGVSVIDYVIQSAVGGPGGCNGNQLPAIGTFAHEMGHAFGIPDLYDYTPPGEGIGHWGLMGSGNWNRQTSPAHMSAWTKDRLGWIAIDTILPGSASTLRTLEPIVSHPRALRLDGVGSAEYFLLENRQRLHSDAWVSAPGLLVWHIDNASFTRGNSEVPYGVALMQADGAMQLENGHNRGDTGDPYPGATENRSLTPFTVPSSNLNTGEQSWVSIMSIQQNGNGSMEFVMGSSAPDLTVEVDPFDVAPQTVAAGETVQGPAWTIRNVGAVASGEFHSALYLSTDTVITVDDDQTEMYDDAIFENLGAGESAAFGSSTWQVPVTYPPGDYFVGFLVDDSASVNELDEANNYVSTRINVTEPPAGTILVEVGPEATGSVLPGTDLTIPIGVDMSAASALDLASLEVQIDWDPGRLTFGEVTAGTFGNLTVNTADTGTGALYASLFSATSTTEDFVAFELTLQAGATEGATDVTLVVQTAGNQAGENITSFVSERDLSLCIGQSGFWGDVTADDAVNVIDAQQIARHSVGLDVADSDRVDSHGDVTGDDLVNIIDAQQVARYTVGLPTSGRAGEQIAGGCQ